MISRYILKIKKTTEIFRKALRIFFRIIRYFYRHLFIRPVYLYNYISKYFDNYYIEKVKFYTSDEVKNLLNGSENRQAKSIIRLGDGEIHMHIGGSIDGYQKYNKRLANYYHKIISEYNSTSSPYILAIPTFVLQDNRLLREKNLLNCWLPLKSAFKTYFNKNEIYADAHVFYREGQFDYILRPILESHKLIMIAGQHNVALLESDKVKIHEKLNIKFIETRGVQDFDDFDNILKKFNLLISEINTTPSAADSIGIKIDIKEEYRILVAAGPTSKAIVYELSRQGYICYDIGKGVETMYQENKVQYMIG